MSAPVLNIAPRRQGSAISSWRGETLMIVLAPLWLALLIMLFSRPVYALKMIAAFLIVAA
jgi:hypothetical protein